MAINRVVGLSSYINALRIFCRVKDKFRTQVRNAVPEQYRATFDQVDAAVTAMCAIIEAIDFVGDGVGSN